MSRPHSGHPPHVGRGALLVTLLLAQACASAAGARSGSANVITQEQFDPNDENAFLIVRRLRPAWLRARTQETLTISEPAFAQVRVDETLVGDVDYLYRISASHIARIEYLSALDATTLYGMGYMGGLIIVRTINSRP